MYIFNDDFNMLTSPPPSSVNDKDFSSAKALYEEWQKSGGEIDMVSLKWLAVMYRKFGETVPFNEPRVSLTHIYIYIYIYTQLNVIGSST